MVSCKEESEVSNKILYGGKEYTFDYVYTNYVTGEGIQIVFSTNSNLKDIFTDEGKHFEFEVPLFMINKTSTYGKDPFEASWFFCGSIFFGGQNKDDGWSPSDGTVLTMSCETADNKVTELSFNYNGTANGKELSVSFSGTPDVSVT